MAKSSKSVRRPAENAALARIRRQARKLNLSETIYIGYCRRYGEIIVRGKVDSTKLRHAQALQLAGMAF